METTSGTDRKMARLAGALFIFVCIPMSMWAQMFVPSRVFVAQDPVATATNLLAHEFMFRVSIAMNMAGFFFFAFMMSLFYRIFKSVDQHLALLMIMPIIAQIAITFMLEALNFAAVLIVKSEPRAGFDVAQQQEAVYFLMRIYRAVMSCDKLLLGVSFIPLGMLVRRSGSVPRVLGTLIIINGCGYIADSITGIVFDRSIVLIIRPYLRLTIVGFLLTTIWMMVKGVQERKASIA